MENDKVLRASLKIAQMLMAYHRYEVKGMEHIPREGGALIAVNHSLATYDGFLLGAEIMFQTGRYPAGLADKRIFQTPGLAQLFTRLRTVEGSPEAGMRLLAEGNLLMLAPGGMRESLRPRSRHYQIDWEGRLGFARLAIRAQVPVCLAACPAADDIFTVYDNPVTPEVYRRFKWPLPLLRGWGPTVLPRPVKLVHYLDAPLYPPKHPVGERPGDEMVAKFHRELVGEMDRLMASR